MEDNGKLFFEAGLDNSTLAKEAEEAKQLLASLGQQAEIEGVRIDSALNGFDASGIRALSKAASEALSLIGKEFDTETIEQKIEALEEVIRRNEEVSKDLAASFDDLGAKAKEAFAAGNFNEFDNLTVQMETTAAQMKEVSDETENFRLVLESLETAAGTASASTQQLSQSEEQNSNIMITLLGGQEKYNAIIGQLPEGLQGAIKGLEGMTGAAKAFIATPLGAILAGIILALKTLKTWFDSTVEGQMAFAKVSGYVSGVLGQLKEIVIAVGKAIYNAFANPKEAVEKLWQAIKTNIVNRFKAVGDMAANLGAILKAAFTFDAEGIKKAVKDLGESFLQFGTGVEDVTGKIGNWAKGVHEAATATSEIKVQQRELEIQVSEWQKKKEELEQAKQEARMKMYDTSLSKADRKKALDDYKAALDEQLAQERIFADKRIELQKRTMSLTSNTIEDENTLRDLEAARAKIDTQGKAELAMLQRRSNSITNPNAPGGENAELKAEAARGKELLNLQNANRQAEIDAMAEGSQKKITQLNLNYENEIAALQELEEKWKAAQGGKLDDDQQTTLKASREYAKDKRDSGIAEVSAEEVEAALQGIRSYEQRRTEIVAQYVARRKALYKDENEEQGFKDGINKENLEELNRQQEEALAAVDQQFAARSDTFAAWCEQIGAMTLEQLKTVLDKAQKELDALTNSGEKDSKKLAEARAKVQKAQQAVNKAQSKQDLTPGKRTIKEWEDLYSTLQTCAKEFQNIGDEIGGVAGEAIKTAGSIMSSSLSMINGIVQLVQTSGTAMVATAGAGVSAIKTLETASVILTVISAALSIAMTIANLFNSDEAKQEQIEALQNEIDNLQWEIDNANTIRLQEEYGKALTHTAEAMHTYKKTLWELYVQQLRSAGARSSAIAGLNAAEIHTRALNAATAELVKTYGSMKYSADKALGDDKFKQAQTDLENYSQQILLVYEQMEAEQSKKKSDSGAISEYEKTIEELGQKAVDVINEAVEEIIGGNVADIAEQLGDAFIDAFREGEDAAKAWGEAVNDIVSDILKKMLISQYLEQPLGAIFDKYKDKWYKEGQWQGTDAVINSMGEFANDLNGLRDQFSSIWDNLPEEIRTMLQGTTEAAREASQEGIATASQESIDELNGRMTAVQSHTFNISENSNLLVDTSNQILAAVLNINDNAESIERRLAAVEAGVRVVREVADDISMNGIKIK